jgi:predicted AlkP superfamily pyrophosphatase or phosphodiesterase
VKKTAVVLVDGLRYDAACQHLGWLEGMVEEARASREAVVASLPTTSRPCYATLLTGRTVAEHGIGSNSIVRKPDSQTLFDVVTAKGGRVAVVGFHFFFELAYGRKYDPVANCEWQDAEGPITWGWFYQEEDMPDREVAWRARRIAEQMQPELLWVHLNGLDDVGHKHGGSSREYIAHVHEVDAIIAEVASSLLPEYSLYVTGDHGMGDEGLHRGSSDAVRLTPLYVFDDKRRNTHDLKEAVTTAPMPQWQLGQLLRSAYV